MNECANSCLCFKRDKKVTCDSSLFYFDIPSGPRISTTRLSSLLIFIISESIHGSLSHEHNGVQWNDERCFHQTGGLFQNANAQSITNISTSCLRLQWGQSHACYLLILVFTHSHDPCLSQLCGMGIWNEYIYSFMQGGKIVRGNWIPSHNFIIIYINILYI